MNRFNRLGIKFIIESQISKNIKQGFYSNSFNADIIPLIHLHLIKQKENKNKKLLKKKITKILKR